MNKAVKIRDTRDLRLFLTDQMQQVAEGKVGLEKAKGVANLAQQVYNSLNLEVKMTIAKSKLKQGQKIEPVSFD